MTKKTQQQRKFIIPEVVQTSSMDCGPATLKCVLEGYGISVSYGRLREVCQTDVDGTSIDTIEEIIKQFGLNAEQIMIPTDHVFLKEAQTLPAIIVVRNPNGTTHFVVIWQKIGQFLQIMDPAQGRRWISVNEFQRIIHKHTQFVPTHDWREWAISNDFLIPLKARCKRINLNQKETEELINKALTDPSWRSLAALDATIRFLTALQQENSFLDKKKNHLLCQKFFSEASNPQKDPHTVIPRNYWSVHKETECEDSQLKMTGTVLIRILGESCEDTLEMPKPLSSDTVAQLKEKQVHSLRQLWTLLKKDGLLSPLVLASTIALTSFGLFVEVLLFRTLIDIGKDLGLTEQRLGLIFVILMFLLLLLVLEFITTNGFLGMGRKIELRLRMTYLIKIPKLCYQYFNSRLISDMAERCHRIRLLRSFPQLGRRFMRAIFEILFVSLGLIWLYPQGTPLILAIAFTSVLIPLLMQPIQAERDLRTRNHASALRRFYLDALIGLMPIRTHAAENTIRREHENLLIDWINAKLGLEKTSILINALQSIISYGLVASLLILYLMTIQNGAGALLMVYWALSLPVVGQELAMITKTYPSYRNVTLRLFELLTIPDSHKHNSSKETNKEQPKINFDICFNQVTVKAGGHTILKDINLSIPQGQHVAIVGKSGAGKSSLVGLLLGWHQPCYGKVSIHNQNLDETLLDKIRSETAWLDPAIQLWNKSLLENLYYGNKSASHDDLDQIIQEANLKTVLKTLPNGLQTKLGESGSLVSGGEGQRVRFARALFRKEAKLVILDEPFRGLDRQMRMDLLNKARQKWHQATLICVTHDIKETQGFDHVIVMAKGAIIEQGNPKHLLENTQSHYCHLLKAEENIVSQLWSSDVWKKIHMHQGEIKEGSKST